MKKKTQALALGIASITMVGIGTGVVEAAGPTFNPVYSACLTKQHTLINVTRSPARPDACPSGTLAAHWNATGPAGPRGASGAQGMPGANGSTVLNGSGAPSSTTGNVGDFYIDTTNWVIYGPKNSSGWPTPGHELQGPAGASGGGGGSSSTVDVTVVRGDSEGTTLGYDSGAATVASYELPPGGKFVIEAKVVIIANDNGGRAMAATCQLGQSGETPDVAVVALTGDGDIGRAAATVTLMNDYDTTGQTQGSPNYTVQLRCFNNNSGVEDNEVAQNAVLVITKVDTLHDASPGEVYTSPPT